MKNNITEIIIHSDILCFICTFFFFEIASMNHNSSLYWFKSVVFARSVRRHASRSHRWVESRRQVRRRCSLQHNIRIRVGDIPQRVPQCWCGRLLHDWQNWGLPGTPHIGPGRRLSITIYI